MQEEAARAAGAAQEAAGTYNPGDSILHHMLDRQTMELPFVGEVHLPTLHLGPWALPITRSVVMMWVAAILLLVLVPLAVRRKTLVPGRGQGLVELLVLFVRDEVARKSIGHGADRYVPFLTTVFFFILTCNLLGLVPYASTATGTIGVTAGLAGLSFIVIQAAGIRGNGLGGHLKTLMPPGIPFWLMPIMIIVEILSMLTKPVALCLRLFANMTAGHVAILSLISMVFVLRSITVGVVLSVPFAVFMSGLEILVAVLQAYIFTALTALFIGMSAHPAH